MKQVILTIILVFAVGLSVGNAQAGGETRYALKLCTGIDQNGNTFDGSQCKDELENGPCDRESVCYESIAPV